MLAACGSDVTLRRKMDQSLSAKVPEHLAVFRDALRDQNAPAGVTRLAVGLAFHAERVFLIEVFLESTLRSCPWTEIVQRALDFLARIVGGVSRERKLRVRLGRLAGGAGAVE